MSPTKPIRRVTLFKIPAEEDQQKVLAIYKEMPDKAKRDGQPYILSLAAGPTIEDQRNQGYTIAVISIFASEDDMKYYDNECEAHAALKKVAKPLLQGMMMVYFESIFD
ncbi:hypothetical protein BP5796_11996 [Coleophoma crateriformis]|uniref:Stress-response A/B barrel domain-containing protein n=1 Tax=Coleophoma crateriformis TaxID=565419 RepID=A0A3D8QB50_9HELO|nr:hypothetical protein BP5796_11996 [Coleophoma crateriformis]